MADFSDQSLTCRDCGSQFVWTAGEQQFYADKGFANAPVRCPNCRQAKKTAARSTREMYQVTCASCGQLAEVPFQPKPVEEGGRPVYCSDCYKKVRETGAGA